MFGIVLHNYEPLKLDSLKLESSKSNKLHPLFNRLAALAVHSFGNMSFDACAMMFRLFLCWRYDFFHIKQ